MNTKPLIALASLLVLLFGTHAVGAQQVEIKLRSGAKIIGELISEDANKVSIKTTTLGKTGRSMSMTGEYKRSDILELTNLADPEQTYAKRATLAKTADEHSALATWCREQAMIEHAVEQAKKALALDRGQTTSAKLMADLGWVEADGKWLKETDLLASQGKVRYQGKIMTLEEAKTAKALEKQQQSLKEAQQVIDGKTSALAKLDLQIEELPKRPAQIEVEMANDTAAMANAQAVTQRVADAKTAFDAADAAVQKAQGSLPTSIGAGGKQVVDTSGLMPLIAASEAAQKAYNDVRRSVGAAEAELVRLKNHQAALQAETKSLDKKALDLTAKREALVKEIEKAKTALTALTATLATPPIPSTPPASPTPPTLKPVVPSVNPLK
jgi:chromosome segregation ATPase